MRRPKHSKRLFEGLEGEGSGLRLSCKRVPGRRAGSDSGPSNQSRRRHATPEEQIWHKRHIHMSLGTRSLASTPACRVAAPDPSSTRARHASVPGACRQGCGVARQVRGVEGEEGEEGFHSAVVDHDHREARDLLLL
jgi:hypothetical protein